MRHRFNNGFTEEVHGIPTWIDTSDEGDLDEYVDGVNEEWDDVDDES